MIVAIVQIPIAPRPREEAVRQATASAPTYRDLGGRGLLRKHYLNGAAGGGGVYLWRTRADAEAWYTDAWRKAMTDRFGAAPVVTYYESLVTVDNVTGETVVES
ncbi:MAG: monooxygenase [Burkholderiales bacterium]|nr:monooxygenase [Burkholderiales bacterium]